MKKINFALLRPDLPSGHLKKNKPRRVVVKDSARTKEAVRNLTPPQTWDESRHATTSSRPSEDVHTMRYQQSRYAQVKAEREKLIRANYFTTYQLRFLTNLLANNF